MLKYCPLCGDRIKGLVMEKIEPDCYTVKLYCSCCELTSKMKMKWNEKGEDGVIKYCPLCGSDKIKVERWELNDVCDLVELKCLKCGVSLTMEIMWD